MKNKVLIYGLLFVFVLAVVFLIIRKGKSNKNESEYNSEKILTNKSLESKKINIRKDVIKKIEIFQEYNSSKKFVRAVPIMNNWVKKNEVEFKFEWFVNDENVECNDMMISHDLIKKDDEVFCVITPHRGNKIFNIVKSDTIIIKNSPPVIHYDSEPYRNDSDIVEYKINATDADGDELVYQLIKPQEGIGIDKKKGIITCETPIEIEENKTASAVENEFEINDKGEKVYSKNDIGKTSPALSYIKKIKFKVIDTNGAEAVGTVTIDLKKGIKADEG